MLESKIEEEGNKAAKATGWLQRKVAYIGRKSAPDRWYFKSPGRLRIVEYKSTGEEPDDLQAREIKRLRDMGFDVRVIDNVRDARAAFDE
jgi:hypothetical protein